MDEKGKRAGKSRVIFAFILVITAFLISFSSAAYLFMNSKNLVFSENEKELERLTILLGEKDSEIAALKTELERYKKLYENELLCNPPVIIEK